MYVQIMTFAGPRGPELVDASERAGRERIAPLVQAHPDLRDHLVGGFRAVGPDGHEVVVTLADSEEGLDELQRIVMSSELLPGEDPALLTGPTAVERFPVTGTFGELDRVLEGRR